MWPRQRIGAGQLSRTLQERMTSIAANESLERAAPARVGPGGFSRAELAVGAMVGLAFVGLFYRWILRQFGTEGWSWHYPEDWGHAYVVPFISAYMVWRRKDDLARCAMGAFWPGLSLILLGIVSYVYFITGYANHMFQGFAVVLCLGGIVMLLLGPHALRLLAIPVAYLAFTATISQRVMDLVTFRLRLLASEGSWAILNMVGIDADLDGNILKVRDGERFHELNVADACAGMRMVVAFVALAVAVAVVGCTQWWQRIAVCLLAIPVAVLMNVVRVAVLGGLTLWDANLSVGGAHALIGTLLLVPAFGLFMACVWALKKIAPDGPEGGAA